MREHSRRLTVIPTQTGTRVFRGFPDPPPRLRGDKLRGGTLECHPLLNRAEHCMLQMELGRGAMEIEEIRTITRTEEKEIPVACCGAQLGDSDKPPC